MISHLRGRVVLREPGYVVLDVSGVGYKVSVSSDTESYLSKEGRSEEVSLWTYMAVRENSQDLYGFTDREELGLFELLIGVSGIGPKSALAILSLAGVETLKSAIGSSDTSYLTKVSGIGKKNAEKIVLELRDKLGEIIPGVLPKEEVEAIEALKALGYGAKDAREALKKIGSETDTKNTGEMVKAALKNLNTK